MSRETITYPVYANDKLVKDGSINGVPLQRIWEECEEWGSQYIKDKFPQLLKSTREEKKEIRELWKQLSKEQKATLKNTKGTYIT